jgi:predicted transposase/invertase (TIGR01784 family)
MTRAVRYCRDHDILKEFFEQNAAEVMNMLITEWKLEDAQKVWYEDGIEEGIVRGREEGIGIGIEKGREEGREEGIEKGKESIARNALAKGLTPELICSITGLDMETIKSLQ